MEMTEELKAEKMTKLEAMHICNVVEYDTGERRSNLTIVWENGERHKASFPASSPEVVIAFLEMLSATLKRDLKEGNLNYVSKREINDD